MHTMSLMQRSRCAASLLLPKIFSDSFEWVECEPRMVSPQVASQFPKTGEQGLLQLKCCLKEGPVRALRIGVLFSGGPAPGQHNVVCGIYDALQKMGADSLLIGFLEGFKGLLNGSYEELGEKRLRDYRNSGGCDLLGASRVKVEGEDDCEKAYQQLSQLGLDGLVVIGGDDSQTNVAFLAEYLKAKESSICVVGVPKTIDGDLQTKEVKTSFGFDTACRVYSELVGNIARDSASARKYYHCIRLMGRSSSHIVLETALQTQPNLALIAEEVAEKGWGLLEIAKDIADLVQERESKGKSYGVILIPEGIIEVASDMKQLIGMLNAKLSSESDLSVDQVDDPLFCELPRAIQEQLLFKRDPHGNVHVSAIESEKLLMALVQKELEARGRDPIQVVHHFLGYEARASFPSSFDAHYTNALGHVAASLIQSGKSGYMAGVTKLTESVSDWEAVAVPIASLMHLEERKGKKKAVVAKRVVDCRDAAFCELAKRRGSWRIDDCYLSPGPMQLPLADPQALTEQVSETLKLKSLT